MQIIRAPRFSGFCGGVKRAWTIALRTRANTEGPVYLSGELINNDPALRELEERGLKVLRVIDGEVPPPPSPAAAGEGGAVAWGAAESTPAGTLVMRAHGESPITFERAQQFGLNVVDATCGIVLAVQKKAKALEDAGYQVILYGHREHPEAKATVAYTQHGIIVGSVEEAEALPHFERIAALAQTTVLLSEYERICAVLETKTDHLENQGQICAWTRMAQDEAEAIAPQCTVMIVVGGHKSSNTKQLVEVCKRHTEAYLVETAEEVEPGWFAADSVVGICAGASTREDDVQAVIKRIQQLAHSENAKPPSILHS